MPIVKKKWKVVIKNVFFENYLSIVLTIKVYKHFHLRKNKKQQMLKA